MHLTTRLKVSKQMIRLARPFELSASDLIYPIFVREDRRKFEVPSMKGQEYLSLNDAVNTCGKAIDCGIPAIMVFGIVKAKDADASVALKKDAFHTKIFRKLKTEFGEELVLISNVCLCDYTKDEFCVYTEKGKVLNEKTAEMLGKISVVHAEAGADVVAPAAMCDGQVRHMRQALNSAGFDEVAIMSYVKTDSCLFNPFKEAMTSSHAHQNVDSSRFRTDIINGKMFMQKVELDISEGADIIIVKPALTNLDLIMRVKQEYPTMPIAAYQVSGEYAMINLLAEHAHIDADTLLLETLNSIKRSGADMILTYHALKAASLVTPRAHGVRCPKIIH
ncbi:MAG: porphobilinogen synthase [Candidatus Bathyarchaeia archaeon]|jgi:porphobilinogen synthase